MGYLKSCWVQVGRTNHGVEAEQSLLKGITPLYSCVAVGLHPFFVFSIADSQPIYNNLIESLIP